MGVHRRFPMREPSQVGEARRAAVHLAEQAGFGETAAGRVALVATELGNNLVRHAAQGELLIACLADGDEHCIEILSVDAGPGMAAVDTCLQDGYSTAGTPGTGLGAVRRLADTFDVHSQVPGGTIVLARIGLHATAPPATPPAPFLHGAVAVAAPGETVSGDAWSVASAGPRLAVMVADGLGHGPDAARAGEAALSAFGAAPFDGPCRVLEQAHAAARGTRGAAAAMALLDAQARTVAFAGAGNVAGRLISGVESRTLMSQHGTVGLQVRRLQEAACAWPEHAVLILHSDGIASRWELNQVPGLLRRHPTVIAAWLLREHERGRDDATIVVIRHV
ncbi:ATP-binding SpoIIE family protein phosphatase [Aquincola sp. MAHUQ-54]|uniref:ATP-binding SpoIIE family protein phosphatase n=1 Tax=Aquincola agrisoli TaxID=3119538 RepID=A0AAW9Q904_9BURK